MSFTYDPPDDERFHQMLVLYLQETGRRDLAEPLIKAKCEVVTDGRYSRVRWDGFATTLRITVPLRAVGIFTKEVQRQLLAAAAVVMPPSVGYDFLDVDVAPAFDDLELRPIEEARPPSTQIRWSRLDDNQFERLIFDLVSTSRGYNNAQWLTHTNAPDDGRDLSVDRVLQDPLAGTQTFRVIVACKHYTSRSISPGEVGTLRTQMELWQPPRVHVLVIATSGRFTSPAVRLVEAHNQSDSGLSIEMWANSHLESLLAKRQDLLAKYGLTMNGDIPDEPDLPF